ncbi:hypothetical protein WJX73_007585 [Symbiochloris irregularis]|uniref:DUF7811 domain-containing protein n=1 Tax=Symbiochloris irregularis TaxID=706552 RepID=A0AAW1P0V4_9CHLO
MGSSDENHRAETFTFFTSEGLVQLRGSSPSPAQSLEQVLQSRQPMPSQEEQGLCLGSTFWVAATNGVDPARRLKIAGFCRSKDLLAEVVEHSVRKRGGEIMHCESQMDSGLHENLKMIVAIPLLWGVPPEHEALRAAITLGGGIVDKVYRQWFWY